MASKIQFTEQRVSRGASVAAFFYRNRPVRVLNREQDDAASFKRERPTGAQWFRIRIERQHPDYANYEAESVYGTFKQVRDHLLAKVRGYGYEMPRLFADGNAYSAGSDYEYQGEKHTAIAELWPIHASAITEFDKPVYLSQAS